MASSAQDLFDTAPLGALVAYRDGSPQPPPRFTRKLAAWRRFNGVGRLDEKTPTTFRGAHEVPARFTLHVGDFGSYGTVVMTVRMVFDVRSPLTFAVVDAAPGTFVCFLSDGVHLEVDRVVRDEEEARLWLASPRLERAFVATVQADRSLRRLPPVLAAAA